MNEKGPGESFFIACDIRKEDDLKVDMSLSASSAYYSSLLLEERQAGISKVAGSKPGCGWQNFLPVQFKCINLKALYIMYCSFLLQKVASIYSLFRARGIIAYRCFHG